MIILDTNVVYAFFIQEDSLHEKAVDLIRQYQNQDLFIIPRIWEELMTLISIRFNSKKAILFDQTLKKSGFIFYDPKIKQNEVWTKFWRKKSPHRMSFADCVLGYLNNEKGITVLTFDQELQKYLH